MITKIYFKESDEKELDWNRELFNPDLDVDNEEEIKELKKKFTETIDGIKFCKFDIESEEFKEKGIYINNAYKSLADFLYSYNLAGKYMYTDEIIYVDDVYDINIPHISEHDFSAFSNGDDESLDFIQYVGTNIDDIDGNTYDLVKNESGKYSLLARNKYNDVVYFINLPEDNTLEDDDDNEYYVMSNNGIPFKSKEDAIDYFNRYIKGKTDLGYLNNVKLKGN